jgi:hypothetical protein
MPDEAELIAIHATVAAQHLYGVDASDPVYKAFRLRYEDTYTDMTNG